MYAVLPNGISKLICINLNYKNIFNTERHKDLNASQGCKVSGAFSQTDASDGALSS